MKINLYPEMNAKISGIMRLSEQPAQMYGAALIDAYRKSGLEPDEIPHWISCSEKLPETDGENTHAFDVLVYVPKRDGCSQNGYYLGKLHKVEADNTGNKNFWGIKTSGSKWTLWGWGYFEEPIPSHWMLLPQPPKGKNHEH
jgi:hypothetical protein